MSFVTLRDLDTDDTVIGQDWQDLRDNFEYIKTPPQNFLIQVGPYTVSGASWQDTDPTNLKFTLSVDGGPVVVYFGCYVTGVPSTNTMTLRVLIGGVDPGVYGRSSIYYAADHANIAHAFPWVLEPGDHEIALQHYVSTGSTKINYAYVAAREF